MFFKYNLAGILWAVFILILCGIPGNKFPDLFFWSLLSADKIIHIFLFAVLVTLLTIGLKKQYSFVHLRNYAVIISVLISIFYGALTEVLQTIIFIARTGNIYDFIANTIGCLSGIFLYRYWEKYQTKFFCKNKT